MKSRYPEAAQAILNWISDRKLVPGVRLPSARLLAGQVGFPRFIMDRACQDLITRGILIRKGYKLTVGAGNVSNRPTQGRVEVLSYGDGFLKFAGRIMTELGVRHRLVELTHLKYQSPLPVLRQVLSEKPAGVILWMPTWNENLRPALEFEKIPMVICADGVPPGLNLHFVGTDYYRGTEKALRHLRDLGHRHIAHVTLGPPTLFSREIVDCYRNACLKLKLHRSASAVWQVDSSLEEIIRETLLEQRGQHPEVTAIFGSGHVASAAAKIFRVPEELSVVGLLARQGRQLPLLTTVKIPDGDDSLVLWACTELIAQIQALEAGKPARLPRHTLFVPDLIVGQSTRALTAVEQGKPAQAWQEKRPHETHSQSSPGDLSAQPANLWASMLGKYPYLEKGGAHKWRQLDLSGLANHSLTKEHGWLGGEPLLHFAPGMRSLHGVPFQVINENLNGGCAVVTFLSPHTRTAHGKQLPSTVMLPVGKRVKALYFLHGCGFARPVAFGEYIMRFKEGKTATVPLIPLGPSRKFACKRLGRLKPNLQDWWTGMEAQDFSHARHALVFNPSDPTQNIRTLYTLEWINPSPQDVIASIKVRVDPKAGPALALIAVTALL